MKKLIGGSDKKTRKWAEYAENEYDWDSGEDAVYEDPEDFYGEAIEEEDGWTEEDPQGDGNLYAFGDRSSDPAYEDEEPYGERSSYGDGDEPYGDGLYRERSVYGDDEPYGKRSAYRDDDEPYGKRVAYGDDEDELYGERSVYGDEDEPYRERSSYGDGEELYGERSAYGDDKDEPYGDGLYRERSVYGDDEPYRKRSAYRDDDEPYGERAAYGDDEDELYGEEEPVYEDGGFYGGYGPEDAVPEKAAPRRAQPLKGGGTRSGKQPRQSFLAKVGKYFGRMDTMDKVMAFTGAGVLVLAIITGCIFVGTMTTDRQVADFRNVGTQLDDITVIGEQGLLAVANAQRDKLAASEVVDEEPEEDDKPDYDESGYERQVSVLPSFTSIQKDLKIKFINKKTDKLVANVPFSVTITDPDGKTNIWSDDDMDGIIYKKDIAPGTYKVALEALTDEKYAGYTLSMDPQSVEVKKEIAYKKVDVTNEVKQESEVNTKQEDTKKNEVVVESSLQDTVAWVESKVIATAYDQVDKSTIQDPMTLAVTKRFLRMSENTATGAPDTGTAPGTDAEPGEPPATEAPTSTPPAEESPTPTPPATESPTPTPPAEESPTPTPPATESPTPTPPATESPTPTPPAEESPTPTPPATESPTPTPTPTPTPAPLTVTVNQATLTGTVGGTMAAIASASGFPQGSTVEYIISSDNAAVAAASIDDRGNITIQGKAVGTANLTVTANYKNGAPDTAGKAVITVIIKGSMIMRLDKNAVTVFNQSTVDITATVVNAALPVKVEAVSSDAGKCAVSVRDNIVTATGVAEGSAVITISYTEGTETVTATCAVTVKKNPREDTGTLLRDVKGQQVYVKENDNYREATNADYYTAAAFYIKADARYTGWQTIDGKVYYYTADGKKVTGEQVIQGAKYNFASDGSMVVGSGTVGIDVSKWNGKIDWNGVKNSGISYVIIRCGYRGSTEGKLIVDSRFAENIQGANAAGLKVGVYFYSQAVDEVEAVEEASMVLDQIRNYKISYPVFLDVESSGGRGDKITREARTAVCKAFCQTIQNAGYTAGVYSNKNWLETKIDAGALSAYKIWMAQYAAAPTYKSRYDLWQYRSTGSVNGISGNVDMNISYLGY